jgi:two-component system copper resistance phosphate regulon response regulator CusR
MRLLFAEDDRHLLTSISRGLREASHEVDQAANGTQALSLALANEYDGIILDVLLPGKSGIEVCRPILMLTALDAVEQRIEGLDAGADDYLTKPFNFGELLARLRALDRRHGDTLTSRIAVGDLVLDGQRRVAQRGGRDIPLTAREFAFLAHLARNAGRVVSRAELMAEVWDDQRNTYSNIIDVYAVRLRRKIDEGEAVPLFSTVRGVGFVLEVPKPSPSPATRRKRAAPRRE